jgi:competence protein ComFC
LDTGTIEQRPLAYRLYRYLWRGLDWLYPPTCASCEQKGSRWCIPCQDRVELIQTPVCPRCGQSQPKAELCRQCRIHPPTFTAARSWAAFRGPVRQALHRLKYKGDIAMGDILAQPLVTFMEKLDWKVELVVPVPLGVARFAERGYNQAALIARPIALALRLPYQPKALEKVRETRSQVDLNVAERKQNVAGAFQAHAVWVGGSSVLVIDDVTTSGSTLDACAAALFAAGAKQVYGLTLARAVLDLIRPDAV